ncbi:hypothetical protein T484DRAFT_2848099 [Baffinella frigidus]|nr:hypothetical protein T484DRAFT_2848099 [Cryptophyta sp. CCMP2293]
MAPRTTLEYPPKGPAWFSEIDNSLPNNQRQRHTCDALCHYCTPCWPLIRAFSGWILTPPPTGLTERYRCAPPSPNPPTRLGWVSPLTPISQVASGPPPTCSWLSYKAPLSGLLAKAPLPLQL